MQEENDIRRSFRALTGHSPFPWQERLYARILRGHVPSHCDIPTGLGKTSVIALWLLALADSRCGEGAASFIPRRLVYVVDRRVVVDQATAEVETWLHRLQSPDSGGRAEIKTELARVAEALASAGVTQSPLPFSISTLRGQFADNRQWQIDPARPAVIIGTVDMIGSRLLFRGYGRVGPYSLSMHAGLLGQDALIVLDEAHLSRPFAETLQGVGAQIRRKHSVRPFSTMLLSATLPPHADSTDLPARENSEIFQLDETADRADPIIQKRLYAHKSLSLFSYSSGGSGEAIRRLQTQAEAIAAEALTLGAGVASVVVFCSTVELVNAVDESLRGQLGPEKATSVLRFTGEMRGLERDSLLETSNLIACFAPDRDRGQQKEAMFLVATAAAEVGFNFDADHAVCDLVSLDRMIQRFGRVNRFGSRTNSKVRVAIPLSLNLLPSHGRQIRALARALDSAAGMQKAHLEKRLSQLEQVLSRRGLATLRVLAQLPKAYVRHRETRTHLRSVAPIHLSKLSRHCDLFTTAFSPRAAVPCLDEARIDDWSMTSLAPTEFPKPRVSYWLRGVVPDDTIHVWFCWRSDLSLARSEADAAALAEAIYTTPAEIAQVEMGRAVRLITRIAKRHGESFVALVDASGTWHGWRLAELAKDTAVEQICAFGTLYLPSHVGGLRDGQPDLVGDAGAKPVADAVDQDSFVRVLLEEEDGGVSAREISPSGQYDHSFGSFTDERGAVRRIAAARDARLLRVIECNATSIKGLPVMDDDMGVVRRAIRIAYFARQKITEGGEADFSSIGSQRVLLGDHLDDVTTVASALAQALGLSDDLTDALVLAARWHDQGKARPWWQLAVGNDDSAHPIAKSCQEYMDRELNAGYRHEFGSVVDAESSVEIQAHPRRDLILHLIASHHGRARPSFDERAFDRQQPHAVNLSLAREIALRFSRLQRQYGWWQLAYLESLLKCADAVVSAGTPLKVNGRVQLHQP